MRRPGEALDIQHHKRRVGDDFAEHGLGVGLKRRLQFLIGAIGLHEREFHAHLAHGHREQIVRAAVDGGAGHDMIAACGDIERRIEVCRLAA